MSGIKPIVACHLKIPFRDMLDQELYKVNDRAPQVAADILNDGIGVGKGRFCIDIKAVLIFAVDKGFGLFEGRADSFSHFIEKDSLEKAVQEGAVFQEEMPELLVDSKDAVAVVAPQKPEEHGCGTLLAVLYATGRTEAALAAERDELHLPASGVGIHGSAEGRVATVYHLFDVLHHL